MVDVDYLKSTGTTGTMRLRDTGSLVEFWINSGDVFTPYPALSWGFTLNGVTDTRTTNVPANAGWKYLGAWTIADTQTVTFRLFATGKAGLGGPTTLSVSIVRYKPPNTPGVPQLSNITGTSVIVSFIDGSGNGSAIDSREISYSTSPTVMQNTISSDGSTLIDGLTPNVRYYIKARTHNAGGYSPWSTQVSFATDNAPQAPGPPIVSNITQTSFVYSFIDGPPGGSAIIERDMYYNTVPSLTGGSLQHSDYVANTAVTVTGLLPATTYYLWSRTRNTVGWGAYSSMVTIRTVGGAWVVVGAVAKEAIPYVRVGGAWKLARPWLRSAEAWKETI